MAQQKMTPELLWQLGRVSGEAVSADGKSVLYSVSRYDKDKNKSETHLFSVPLAGGPATQLLPDGGNSNIAVQATKTGFSRGGQYWEMQPDGSQAVQKTPGAEAMDNIRVSPDGRYILFSREVKV
ncbi:MAG TPA: S9 family peptidase, partial [Chitinophaga sp.]